MSRAAKVIELTSGPLTLVNFSKGRFHFKHSPYNVHRDRTSGDLVFSVAYGSRGKKKAYTSFTAVREYLCDRLGAGGNDLDDLLESIP